MNIIEAMQDPELFWPWFKGDSWNAWRIASAALAGLPIGEDGAALYRQCTGRTIAPTVPAREAWFIVGRRGGKSRIAALWAVYLSCFRDHSAVLAPGEVGTLAVIAADRRQARTIMRYIVGFLDAVPMLKAMVTSSTKETVELSNRVVIEIHTASFRSTRGYTLIGVIADELAFWPTDEGGANPDVEILNGLRPGMASIPDALLLCISSPYARRGALWEAYSKHYGNDGDPVLVWQAPTQAMNPNVDPQVIADAYAADEASASSEYGASFRSDLESYVSREVIGACVIPDRRDLPPATGIRYHAFVDPSGGSVDSMTLAVAHTEGERVVVDVVLERKAPFNPTDVVSEFVATLKPYGISRVTGDRYAGEWPRTAFQRHGITYATSDRPKSDLYRDALPLLTAGRVELPDNLRLVAQLLGLERRTGRSGKDSIDHAPRAHDDVANATCGALLLCSAKAGASCRVFHLRAGGPLVPMNNSSFGVPIWSSAP